MIDRSLMLSLFEYKAWADAALFGAIAEIGERETQPKAMEARRILHHVHLVDRIFAAHLRRRDHGLTANWMTDTPPLAKMRAEAAEVDRWFVDYVRHASADAVAEMIDFRFTDGAPGRMSGAEMLAHVITHGGYHRGQVGILLPEVSRAAHGDVFAGYLHGAEPARRA
jgi:uncharacterized damage-inducible protein DinB